jgi:para-aminobenzoate synthetase component I
MSYPARMQAGQAFCEELTFRPGPWATARRMAHLPHLLLLDSAGGPAELARYSYIAADPFLWLQGRGMRGRNPFHALAVELEKWRTPPVAGLPPFRGGAAGLFGYDLCHWLERLPKPAIDEFECPDLAVGFYDWVIAWDHAQERAWIISTGFPETNEAARQTRAQVQLNWVRSCLTRRDEPSGALKRHDQSITLPVLRHPLPGQARVSSNFNRDQYLAAVRRAIEYTHAGDCFQVNLAQRLLAPIDEPAIDLYGRLRERNPAPFACFFDMGDFQVASSSPERFLRMSHDGCVETRPIKGTRPRGETRAADQRRADELLDSAKDRAENIMIVDLLRNDLGRVCEYGSVTVPVLCRLESYRTVHHLVSEVHGRLRPRLTAVDLLKAAFPGGSVTGAPKVRAMEIIAELEPTVRGPYCGGLGWIGFDGAMDSNILIRTFTIGRGWAQFPVGGGIVAGSDPQCEYEETLHKAEGMLRAL